MRNNGSSQILYCRRGEGVLRKVSFPLYTALGTRPRLTGNSLPQSKMVLLSYILPNGPVNYVSITEVIASSFSHRIKKHRPGVQSSISSRSLALLSSWQRHIEDLMNVPAKFGEFLKSFVVWAYTGRVLLHSLRHFQLWLYGQFLGSPGFMNAVLRDFSL